jgi:hypothetical protein
MQSNYLLEKMNNQSSCGRLVDEPILPGLLLFWSTESWSDDFSHHISSFAFL